MKYEKIVNSPKSRNSVRYVPLNKTALDALVKIHAIMGDNDRIVATENGLLVDPSAIHRTMSRILKNCGINGKKDIVHALRHLKPTNSHKYQNTLLRHSYPPANKRSVVSINATALHFYYSLL